MISWQIILIWSRGCSEWPGIPNALWFYGVRLACGLYTWTLYSNNHICHHKLLQVSMCLHTSGQSMLFLSNREFTLALVDVKWVLHPVFSYWSNTHSVYIRNAPINSSCPKYLTIFYAFNQLLYVHILIYLVTIFYWVSWVLCLFLLIETFIVCNVLIGC